MSSFLVLFLFFPEATLCFYVKYINVKNATNQVIICLFEYLDI